MTTLIAAVLSAFVLYGALLPLVGMAIGFLLIVVVPYLLGGLVSLVALGITGLLNQSWLLIPVIALSWGALVLVVRTSKCLRSIGQLDWSEGHYLSAFRLLTLGGGDCYRNREGAPLATELENNSPRALMTESLDRLLTGG